MTRGFITLATGQEMYYMLARNLLYSYRLYTDDPLPFAIMCDRENEYTALFDDVVILQNAKCGYFDKFELLVKAPYVETIFIDADCLAYSDLNAFWDYFKGADDFTGSGCNFALNSAQGYFQIDEVGQYSERVKIKPFIHGGLYFIRRGVTCDAIYKDCQHILQHYDAFRWPDQCAKYADEPVLSLAMAANDCRAVNAIPGNYGIPWDLTDLRCDILTGKCTFIPNRHNKTVQGRMIHWSVYYCKMPTYKLEAEKVNLMVKRNVRPGQSLDSLTVWDRILYQCGLRKLLLEFDFFMFRVVRFLKRLRDRMLHGDSMNK